MKSAIVHGVFLVLALVFAYQTWTRDKTVAPQVGDIRVWIKPVESLKEVQYETGTLLVRLFRKKGDDGEPFFWGEETRTSRPSAGEAAVSPPGSVRQFPSDEAAEETFKSFASFRALRDLGVPSDEQKKEYELVESTDQLTLVFDDGARSLVVGGRIFGSADRYVLDVETNRAYAVAGNLLRDLTQGEVGLRLRKVHGFERDDPTQVKLRIGETLGSATRSLVRVTTEDETGKRKSWADESTPDKPNQTMANLLLSFERLHPTEYAPELDQTMAPLVTVEYYGARSNKLGWLELYKQTPVAPATAKQAPGSAGAAPGTENTTGKSAATPANEANKGNTAAAKDLLAPAVAETEAKPEYYIRTERTRVLGKVNRISAEGIEKDLKEIVAP